MAGVAVADIVPQWLRDRYLWGLPLKDADGNTLPDPLIQMQIDAAMATLERELDTRLTATKVKTRPDSGLTLGVDYDEEGELLHYHRTQSNFFGDIRLPVKQVISVERVRGFYGDQVIYDFPIEWVVIRKTEAWINLVANQGSLAGILASQSGSIPILHLEFLKADFLPGFWAIDYTYGFSGDLPADLADWIGKTAAMSTLAALGSATIRGVTSSSISQDGVSESQSFAAGAGKGIYGDRIDQYQKDLDKVDMKRLRRKYRGLGVWSA